MVSGNFRLRQSGASRKFIAEGLLKLMLKFFAFNKMTNLVRFYAAVILVFLVAAMVVTSRQNSEEIAEGPEQGSEETFVSELPDFDAITDVEVKKQSFFGFLRQYVERENVRILEERVRLVEFSGILETGADLSQTEQRALDAIAKEYRLEDSELSNDDLVEELVIRVDVIPVSLVLAQAATESAWGTSRFAREGNNIFGQWCFDEGCGLVPGRRADDKSHEVRAFASIDASVRGYFRNLNTNSSYAYFRELRAQMRIQDKSLDSMMLASGLRRYSERGHIYVTEVQDIIRINGLLSNDTPS